MITDPDKNNWAAFLWIPRGHRIIKRELNIRKKKKSLLYPETKCQ